MPPLVLTGARLIDGTGAEPVRGRAVVVEDGRIARVSDEGALPKGERRDRSGHTLLPGQINCHVHLCLGAEAGPVTPLRSEPRALTAIKARSGRARRWRRESRRCATSGAGTPSSCR